MESQENTVVLERANLIQKALKDLIIKNQSQQTGKLNDIQKVYKCFCKKRDLQNSSDEDETKSKFKQEYFQHIEQIKQKSQIDNTDAQLEKTLEQTSNQLILVTKHIEQMKNKEQQSTKQPQKFDKQKKNSIFQNLLQNHINQMQQAPHEVEIIETASSDSEGDKSLNETNQDYLPIKRLNNMKFDEDQEDSDEFQDFDDERWKKFQTQQSLGVGSKFGSIRDTQYESNDDYHPEIDEISIQSRNDQQSKSLQNKGFGRMNSMKVSSKIEQKDPSNKLYGIKRMQIKFMDEEDLQIETGKNKETIKEGYLDKKSPIFFQGFHDKIRGCINFKLVKCTLYDVQNNEFTISADDFNKQFKFRTKDKKSCQEWAHELQKVIDSQQYHEKLKVSVKQQSQYFNVDMISQDEFKKHVKTGDILLFETNNFGATLQRTFTNSDFDHVGFVLKLSEKDIFIVDSTMDEGVASTPWEEYIRINVLYQKVVLRKLICNDQDLVDDTTCLFYAENLGKQYQLNLSKILRRQSIKDKQKPTENKEGYFCSELVAKLYKRLGFLDQLKSSCQYWPVSFSEKQNIQLLNGAKLSNEITVVLNKHREQNN